MFNYSPHLACRYVSSTEPLMKVFDARQRVVAYELLFRSGPENFFPNIDGDIASSRVINDSLMTFGLSSLVGSRKVFINVTRKILCEELYAVLPVRRTVIELLET